MVSPKQIYLSSQPNRYSNIRKKWKPKILRESNWELTGPSKKRRRKKSAKIKGRGSKNPMKSCKNQLTRSSHQRDKNHWSKRSDAGHYYTIKYQNSFISINKSSHQNAGRISVYPFVHKQWFWRWCRQSTSLARSKNALNQIDRIDFNLSGSYFSLFFYNMRKNR